MNAIEVSLFVFLCVFGSSLIGIFVGRRLPSHHLSTDSKDVVKLGIGMVAAMASLVLGLMTASVKGSFDATDADIRQLATEIIITNEAMRDYGPGAANARTLLKHYTERTIAESWPDSSIATKIGKGGTGILGAHQSSHMLEETARAWRKIAANTDDAKTMKSEIGTHFADLVRIHWTAVEQQSGAISDIFLVVLIFWLIIIFASFGLFAPKNGTVLAMLLLCSLSISGSVFLILEMNDPFSGLIAITPEPMENALAHQSEP